MTKILYLATEDWFFASHFLPFARAARDCGLEVIVAARVDRHRAILEAAGCRVVALPIERGKLRLLAVLKEIVAIATLIRHERPEIVHCIALRMVILGGLISKFARVKISVLAVTGLGALWLNSGAMVAFARASVRWVVRRLVFNGANIIFENHDDPHEFGLDADMRDVTIMPGAGVDAEFFSASPQSAAPPVKFAVVARMLRTKGIAEAVAAFRQARRQGAAIEIHLYGSPDTENWNSFTENELRAWDAEPGIFWHGTTDDVRQVWRDHHVALLLTYREGLPRMLVEAAASGRPIIATDVPGCREIVRNGVEGFLVPAMQTEDAARAMRSLANDDALRRRMGAAAQQRFLQGFTAKIVTRRLVELYSRLMRPDNGVGD
ncbi:MAG TPA: glycosyltransferase family 4 protein [Xanthobacteraceae bacterium]|jgi:glycosyltransferase involved in cell wall biosynthesis